MDLLIQKKAQHQNMSFVLPSNNSEPYLDQTLTPVGVAESFGLTNRQIDVVANTSKVCLSERNIVERSFARVHNAKMSGNMYPLSHQLTEPSGTLPTPDLPKIHIWLDVQAAFRRRDKPFELKYGLAPGVTYSDHGRDLLSRLTKENALCCTKGLGFNRPDLFARVTQREIRDGTVRIANLLNAVQTELPALTEEEIMGITLGPLKADVTGGYLTSMNEDSVIAAEQDNYQNPANFHQLAQQVR